MEFPTIVYRCPGPHWGPTGTTYDSVGVEDQAQFDEKIAQGWHESLILAADAFLNPSEKADNEASDDEINASPVTRAELEEKAQELGIKFDGRTSDKKLLEKIEEALKG